MKKDMKLRYLHISDLHLGYKEMRGDDWAARALGQDMVVSSMLESIRELAEKGESPDFIILTGDITRTGQREEYDVALAFCKRLLEVKVRMMNCFAVCGFSGAIPFV